MIDIGELKAPKAMRPVVEEIIAITDAVCLDILDEEYADLARRAVAKLARKRPSPLVGGRRNTWAAGIVYALGQVNFLFDPESEPCATADQLSEAFGLAKGTMGSKAKQVRDLLGISPFSPEFQRADVTEQNMAVWLIQVDGVIMDARNVPLDIQVEAYRRGFIPYVPAFGPGGEAAPPESPGTGTAGGAGSAPDGLLQRCAELKRQLVDFGRSQRFARQLNEAVSEATGGAAIEEDELINVFDHFILQRPLADGRTVVEVFTAEHPELTDSDRELLLGWREVVEGVFEIREQAGDAIIAFNLVDELTYRIRANMGPRAFAPLRPGVFMTSRAVPVGDDWMLSGIQQLIPPSARAEMLKLAAELA
jgi:hypothetical protein